MTKHSTIECTHKCIAT